MPFINTSSPNPTMIQSICLSFCLCFPTRQKKKNFSLDFKLCHALASLGHSSLPRRRDSPARNGYAVISPSPPTSNDSPATRISNRSAQCGYLYLYFSTPSREIWLPALFFHPIRGDSILLFFFYKGHICGPLTSFHSLYPNKSAVMRTRSPDPKPWTPLTIAVNFGTFLSFSKTSVAPLLIK